MNQENLPRHIGIIMDGNGRWAKLRNLPRSAGHKIGAKVFRNIVTYCNQIGIQYLTVYAFSTENWKRPKEEVQALMQLFRDYLLETETYLEQKIQVRFIGDLSGLDEELQQLIAQCETSCQDFDGMHLNIALNYGGRDELCMRCAVWFRMCRMANWILPRSMNKPFRIVCIRMVSPMST